ncbi:hypothetical protein ACC716_24995 [Rhizobium johnstonii]|uniref:hypothetical protein n=1 Tax=Rhizobium johnstonii TaxID=3019933 RepID=UPI003F975E9E
MDVKEIFARTITEDMVIEVVPEEAEFFQEIIDQIPDSNVPADKYLGFGGEDTVMVFATTFLLSIGKTVASFLWENGKDAAGQLVKDCSKSAQEAVAKWFAEKLKGANTPSPVHLSKETMNDLTRLVLASPDAAKLSLEQQTKLSRWIETRLASAV